MYLFALICLYLFALVGLYLFEPYELRNCIGIADVVPRSLLTARHRETAFGGIGGINSIVRRVILDASSGVVRGEVFMEVNEC